MAEVNIKLEQLKRQEKSLQKNMVTKLEQKKLSIF